MDHFTAFQPDKDFPDKLIIYDWRDDGFNPDAAQFEGKVIPFLSMRGTHSITTQTPPYDIVNTYDVYTNFYIQAGVTSQLDDKIRIHLPDLRLETINLKGYSVFEDGYYKFGFEEGTPGRDVTTTVYSEDDYDVVNEEYEVQQGRFVNSTNAQGEPENVFVVTGTVKQQRQVRQLKQGATGTSVTTTVGAVPPRTTKITVYRPSSLSELDFAIDYVLAARAQLGADQNRLEHALKITDNIQENTQSAESLIRDTDMANEMVRLSIQNILEQSGISMLTQANQTQTGVLSLLQG